jgi:1-aminocyclopropane-1-carboxylate deaminase/D-cysteine desulfhydrase-like pyridoxal-dependent ACC family enzyme
LTDQLLTYFSNNPDLKKILNAERIVLGNWPTALVKNTAHKNFYIKRDDLSGYGRGGIKTRKLETFIGHYIKKGKRDFIVIVPNVSNLRHDLELLAITYNLKIHFIVANTPFLPEEKRKGTKTDLLNYSFSGKTGISTFWFFTKTYIRSVFSNAKLPVAILPGASHPSAVIGAANGLIELCYQFRQEGKAIPKYVFVSAASGGSAAGLILASMILKESGEEVIEIVTVKVFPFQLKLWIYFLLLWTKFKYRLKTKISYSSIKIYTEKLDYGKKNEQLSKLCQDIKQQFDLNLDHIYGARTWNAINDFTRKHYKEEGLVFWHCGFTPETNLFE